MPSFGTLKADTLTHSTAGSLATNYVVNGSSKAWVNYNGTGTPAARDSLNLSSITDHGTGDHSTNFSSSLSSGDYVCSSSVINTTTNGMTQLSGAAAFSMTGSAFRTALLRNPSGTAKDPEFCLFSFFGDLA